jgi:hypothetical protein
VHESPEELDAEERSIWTAIVGALPAGAIGRESLSLLRGLCARTAVLSEPHLYERVTLE